MAFAATLHRDARSAERHAVEIDGTLRDEHWQPVDVIVRDLSSSGFRVFAPAALEVGAAIGIGLQGLGSRRAVVVWSERDECGCRFDQPLSAGELATAVAATVTAPAWFPGTRSELMHAAVEEPAARLPRATRAVILVAAAVAAWSPIVLAKLLLG